MIPTISNRVQPYLTNSSIFGLRLDAFVASQLRTSTFINMNLKLAFVFFNKGKRYEKQNKITKL